MFYLVDTWVGYYSALLYLGFSDMVIVWEKPSKEVFLVPKRVVGGRLSGPAPEDLALLTDVWRMGNGHSLTAWIRRYFSHCCFFVVHFQWPTFLSSLEGAGCCLQWWQWQWRGAGGETWEWRRKAGRLEEDGLPALPAPVPKQRRPGQAPAALRPPQGGHASLSWSDAGRGDNEMLWVPWW